MFTNKAVSAAIPPYTHCASHKTAICVCKLALETAELDGLYSDEQWQAYRLKSRLFYCDRGRYERWLVESLRKTGWRQVFMCSNADKTKGEQWKEADMAKRLAIIWTRNRAGMPPHALKNRDILWNHIITESELSKKHLLANNIFGYLASPTVLPKFKDAQPHPMTYFVFVQPELAKFAAALSVTEARRRDAPKEKKDKYLWIIKPHDSSGGKGISVIDSFEGFKKEFVDPSELTRPAEEVVARFKSGDLRLARPLIAQRYISNIFLLNGHKFDIRAYMFIASVDPLVVFFHNGYLRVNIEPYNTSDLDNKWSHISNIGLQKNHPEYEQRKEGTKWSMKTWTKYMLDQKLTTDPNWIDNTLVPQMKDIMEIAFRSVEGKIKLSKEWPGAFALLGVDFLVDKDYKIWLLEYTKTPAGHSTLEKDDTLFGDMMDELFHILLEISANKRQGLPCGNLKTPKDFIRIV